MNPLNSGKQRADCDATRDVRGRREGLWALREAAFMAAVSGVWKAPRPCALVFMLGINESHNGTVH